MIDGGSVAAEGLQFSESENEVVLCDGGTEGVIDAKFVVALYDFDLSDPDVGFSRLSMQAAKDGSRPGPQYSGLSGNFPRLGLSVLSTKPMTKCKDGFRTNTLSHRIFSAIGGFHLKMIVPPLRKFPHVDNFHPNAQNRTMARYLSQKRWMMLTERTNPTMRSLLSNI